MSDTFRWNRFADQPHNVAPKKERFWHHFKHAGSYLSLLRSNFAKAAPILSLYSQYRKKMYKVPHAIGSPMALSVSPHAGRNEEVVERLKETGVRKTLVRLPSWESEKLASNEEFFDLLLREDLEFTIALLQQRDDVLNTRRWERFLEDVFSRFGSMCSFFEIGHAWNRTKWGVWNFKEYLDLARAAVVLAEKYGVKLVGPAVIDFEFQLYPPVIKEISFDKVSSLLYVDRVGAPENTQYGWDTSKKVALLKAVVDGCGGKERALWITEVNWPLKGTGRYSPASGKPNVTEEEQADYLVRYFVLCLASGFIERIYWWQLVAPGYGLIDSRDVAWRKRPSYYAFKNMVTHLEGSTFVARVGYPRAEIFSFRREKDNFLICWTKDKKWGQSPIFLEQAFPVRVVRAVDRDGREISINNKIKLDGSPKYIFYEESL